MINTQNYIKKAGTAEEAIRRLIEIVKVLRIKCPWDKKQTHESLRACMLEEAYEAVEAIDNKDSENLKEELGDVFGLDFTSFLNKPNLT